MNSFKLGRVSIEPRQVENKTTTIRKSKVRWNRWTQCCLSKTPPALRPSVASQQIQWQAPLLSQFRQNARSCCSLYRHSLVNTTAQAPRASWQTSFQTRPGANARKKRQNGVKWNAEWSLHADVTPIFWYTLEVFWPWWQYRGVEGCICSSWRKLT